MLKPFRLLFVAIPAIAGFALQPLFASPQALAANALVSTWHLTGSAPESYEAGWLGGANAAFYLRSRTPSLNQGFGTWSKYVEAAPFSGKRLRLRASIEARDLNGWAGLWMRVDGRNGKVLAFDNMQNRAVRGTSSAHVYEVVLDVPREAVGVGYGVLLTDSGDLKVTDMALDTVGLEVATTHFDPSSKDESRNGGWFLAGSMPAMYTAGPKADHESGYSLCSNSAAPINGFGTWMTTVEASPYVGKRVRLRAVVSTKDVKGWAGLWLRVDGSEHAGNGSTGPNTLAFDNMSDRALKGTSEARPYDVVLSVPKDATKIAYGVLLDDSGEVHTSDLKLEIVPDTTPLTGKQNR